MTMPRFELPRELIAARRERAVSGLKLEDQILVIESGKPIQIPGGFDQCCEFRVHPHFRWITGLDQAGSAVAYAKEDGWVEFLRDVTEHDRAWDGLEPNERGRKYSELQGWLEAKSDRPVIRLGATDLTESAQLYDRRLLEARRPKDAFEIDLIKSATEATRIGYRAAVEFIRPGITERQLQIELESATFRAGADRMGYASIVGFGPNSRVFHFTPGERVLGANDLVLIDAAGEVDGYCADVTRTYTASGKLEGRQKAVHNFIEASLDAGIEMCRSAVEWHQVHIASARVIAQGLVDLGVLVGEIDGILESGAIGLFFPHGVGHTVGLGVRDAGGFAEGRDNSAECCGVKIRNNYPLHEGVVTTVEPGCYFIPALLQEPSRRSKFASQVNWTEVDVWLEFGGVRLEDNVLVTNGSPLNMTSDIPR